MSLWGDVGEAGGGRTTFTVLAAKFERTLRLLGLLSVFEFGSPNNVNIITFLTKPCILVVDA